MATTKKRHKRLSYAQKNMNQKIKKDLQKRGTLPPDKKPLNRKQFALDVLMTVHCDDFNYSDYLSHIIEAFAWMLPSCHDGKIIFPVTPEQVGALKVLKIAIDIDAFGKAKRAEGIHEVNIQEFYEDVIKPIIDL